MEVGLNYPVPFNHDGYGLGPRPGIQQGHVFESPAWKDTLPKNLARLKKMGVTVVRWFVLGNCLNYGEETPIKISLPGSSKWVFTPPDALDDPRYKGDNDGKVRRFEDHFQLMLQTFLTHEMKLIPSLIDFHAFFDPFDHEVSPGQHYLARGRHSILTNSTIQDKFLNTVLDKFLRISNEKKEFKKVIFAWEVMNEPHWNRDLKPASLHKKAFMKPGIPDDVIQTFLQKACERIEKAGFESTVGHRSYKNCKDFETGTVAQFHYYPRWVRTPTGGTVVVNPDPHPIPTQADALKELQAKNSKVKDVFVGEFSSLTEAGLTESQGDLWPELSSLTGPGKDKSEADMLYERFTLLQKKGYKLALVWTDGNDESTDDINGKLKVEKIKSLCRFTGRQFAP
jgi:hypothetical protein